MSNFAIGNLFLFTSIIVTSIGHVLLKKIFIGMPQEIPIIELIKLLLTTHRIWHAGLAGILIVAGFAFWVLCLHRLPLSYAYPFACGSAVVVAALCVAFLGEPVSWRLWAGTSMIALGAALVVKQ